MGHAYIHQQERELHALCALQVAVPALQALSCALGALAATTPALETDAALMEELAPRGLIRQAKNPCKKAILKKFPCALVHAYQPGC